MWKEKLKKISDYELLVPKEIRPDMRVNAQVIANKAIIEAMEDDAIKQLTNVACLPGVIEPVIGLPDAHIGYGLPMGAVGAFDAEKGVISAGCTGFDINCLTEDANVLHEFGYHKKIKDFEGDWPKSQIKCVNPHKEVKNTSINHFLKQRKNKVYQIKTLSGKEIKATADHPFLTSRGMVEVDKLVPGDKVAIFPFYGVRYEKPSQKIIVQKEKFQKKIVNELKKRALIPLTLDSEKLPYLIKIFGFVLGDGCAYKTAGRGIVCFYGKSTDLELIRKDVEKIGYTPSPIAKRVRHHEISTKYEKVIFNREEASFRVSSNSFFALLQTLGLPTENKAKKDFLLPGWLFDCKKWQKRLFLAALFGAELSSPKTVTQHGYNFYGPVLSIDKSEAAIKSGLSFLEQIKQLLAEFDIKSKIIEKRKEYVNKGYTSYRLRLQISAKPANLIKLWSEIGFEYNLKRAFLANLATYYLILKQKVLDERKRVRKKAIELKKRGLKAKKIYQKLESEYINKRFLERSIYESEKNPRIAFNFVKFSDFLKIASFGKTGQVWDSIAEKKELQHKGFVYDFTVHDKHHNFIANGFVVSNCGVNLIRTNLTAEEVKPKLKELMNELFARIPCGVGARGKLRVTKEQLDDVLTRGVDWAIENGYGTKEDKAATEEQGHIEGADPAKVSELAKKRGAPQLGTLGAGNHFLEVQQISDIYDKEKAKKYGLKEKGQVTLMIHCGSRGLGHQIATDYLKIHSRAAKKYGIKLPDPQLVCAPVKSQEGQDYFSAMKAAVNYAFTNRLVITQWAREAFEAVFKKSWQDMDMRTIYSITHNICKYEEHYIPGTDKKAWMYVHRKGATRSYPNTPVLIAGSMGTASYLLEGTEQSMRKTFGSSCHGAGRVMSRHAAIRQFRGTEVKEKLEAIGKQIRATHPKVLAEEAPQAYKDVDAVVDSVVGAGINIRIARMTPLGVAKG